MPGGSVRHKSVGWKADTSFLAWLCFEWTQNHAVLM